MANPLLAVKLRHILLRLLPSPEIKFVGQQLHISNHLDMIRNSLWAINAVIIDANLPITKEPELKVWRSDVHTMIVDVENILQIIQDLSWQPEQKHKVTTPHLNLLQYSSIRSATTLCLSSPRHTILLELKRIAESLNCLLSRSVAFGLLVSMIDSMDPNQVDYYSILRQEVVGIDDDINQILQIIFHLQEGQPSKHINDDVPFIIAITGTSRIGKSTLARAIYHHPLICEFFKHRIWLDISSYIYLSTEHRQIARAIAKHLTGRISSDVDVWNLLRKSLPQTRFLLVLDGFIGITKYNMDKLKVLWKNLLSLGAPGSRVIITCRFYPIIGNDQMGYSHKEYKLNGIPRYAWIKLFMSYAIPTSQPDQAKQISYSVRMTDLLNLADKICGKEQYQNPLYAKLLGSLLRDTTLICYDFLEEYHNYIDLMTMQYFAHELTQIALYIELFKPLPLSLSDDFYDLLIAEGTFDYSTKSQKRILESVNEQINKVFKHETFKILLFDIKGSIYHFKKRNGQEFQIPKQCCYLCVLVDSSTSTSLTKLQTMIADNLRMLMLYKVREEIDLQLGQYQEAVSIEIPKSLRKKLIILSIIDTGIQQLTSTITMLHHLRYLNISEKELEELPKSICKLYNLRVLSLSHCKKLVKLPEQIYKLTKLQILKLAYCTRLQKLPKAITRLVNLQVLDIQACYWLKELPEKLRNLERLMKLHMIGCASLTQIPIGISRLTNLEALLGYIVDDKDHGGLTIHELQSLTSIEQLHVRHLEYMLNLNAIASVNLKEKQYLENLLLHWEWWNMDMRANDQLESFKVLDGLEPNVSRLETLEIISYLGMEFPNWMMIDEQLLSFKSLVKIRLVNLKRCQDLPLLGRLHSLAILEMSGMDSVICVGSTISNDEGTFPKLVELILSQMPNLVQWKLRCPCIQELTLIHCPALVSLYGIELETKLTIWLKSELLGRSSSYFRSIFKEIDELEIVGCHEMRHLPKDIQKCKYLRKLSIIRCDRLLSLPNWLQEMSFLSQVFLSGCTTISYIPKKLKRRLKDHIIVQGCSKLQTHTRREKHVK